MQFDIISVLSIITIIIVLFSFFNEKVLKLPMEIGLMTIAFSLSFILVVLQYLGVELVSEKQYITGFFDVHDIIMNGLICFLLFSGAAKIKFLDLADDKYLISSLAFFSTLVSALIYGFLAFVIVKYIGFKLTLLECFMLGSIIAPTDPVSAMSILKKAGMTKRISIIMEGESLFNDGIAVALFVTFNEMNKNISDSPAIITFFETITYNVFGAVIIGLFVSVPLFIIFKKTEHKHIEVLVSLSAVTSAYSLSEYFKVSAPIGAVVVGIFFATNMNILHEGNEVYYTKFYAFWKVIDRALNGILYIIIGFAMLYLHNVKSIFIIMSTAIIIAFIARYVSVLLPVFCFGRCSKLSPKNYTIDLRRKDVFALSNLLTWGGLKGGICIALALGTSNTVNAEVYNFIVVSTYAVVAFSILVQGLTIRKVYDGLVKYIAVEEPMLEEKKEAP